MFKLIIFGALLWTATRFWPRFFTRLLNDIAIFFSGMKKKSITTKNIRWPYIESNPHGEETILFVHGIRSSKEVWAPYAKKLNSLNSGVIYRIIAIDLPGYGEQPRDVSVPIDIESQVNHLLDFLDAMEISKVHLVGNSMGGQIATKFAIEHGDRLLSLTNMNGAGVIPDTESEAHKLVNAKENPFSFDSIESIDRIIPMLLFKPKYIPRFVKQTMIADSLENRDFYEQSFWQIVEYSFANPLNPDLHKITVPTLVIWGLHDKIFDVGCCGYLEQSIPNCKVAIMHNSAHAPFVEQPRKTAEYNLDFLKTVAAS